MSAPRLTRRSLLGYAPALSAAALAGPTLRTASAQTTIPTTPDFASSIERAFTFQNFMMDAYATGATVRLVQSYSDEALGATAFTYDNAVTILAYLASNQPLLLKRAYILGEGLLYGQAHPYPFPLNDGRFPQAFFVNAPATDGSGAYITPAAAPFYFYSSTTGDQAWAGMALAQLYHRLGDPRFLTAALLVANWIVSNTYDATGLGGYKFGTEIQYINYQNVSVPSGNGKSTEHNIDVHAFFRMLSRLTKDAKSSSINLTWSELAQHASDFVDSMYNAAGPYFYTGTLNNPERINPYPIPEDCQTWSYLSLQKNKYKGTIDYALANLEATDTPLQPNSKLTGSQRIHGLVFDSASYAALFPGSDPQAVWLEGTGHAIAALTTRARRGDSALPKLLKDLDHAANLANNCVRAQNQLGVGKTVGGKAIPQGYGLVAATSIMDTGFGYSYGPSLHIGATGWYLLGVQAANPFQLAEL